MDTLTFITKLIEFLAWPASALVLVLILRKEIRSLLPFVKKLKAGPVEAEFDREVKELRSQAEMELPQGMGFLPPPRQQTLLQLVQINPRSAILEAWQGVEFAAGRVVSNRELSVPPREASSPYAVMRAIMKAGLLDGKQVVLYYDLRSLRNQAAHNIDFSPSQESVLNYIQLAGQLQSDFERLAQNQAG